MTLRIDSPVAAVRVEGRFVAPGLWRIHAVVEYQEDLGMETRRRAGAEGRLELLRHFL